MNDNDIEAIDKKIYNDLTKLRELVDEQDKLLDIE